MISSDIIERTNAKPYKKNPKHYVHNIAEASPPKSRMENRLCGFGSTDSSQGFQLPIPHVCALQSSW
jgi:hypothetical protein